MAEYKSLYADTVLLQDDALNNLLRFIKGYPVAGNKTGIILVPDTDQEHLQIQNALRFYSTIDSSDDEDKRHPGCLRIEDLSITKGSNRTYIKIGDELKFYTGDSEDDPYTKNESGSFILIRNYDNDNPSVVRIKGFDTQGNFYSLGSNITIGQAQNSTLSTPDGSGYLTANKVRGAVFNDYAEYRESFITEPGRCVIETGFGDLELSTKRLQLGANIISDTFGFSIGETDKAKTPIAVCGRVLAYPLEDRYKFTAGAAVCSGPNGTISLMTREEIKEWPDAIIGYVSEIPEYKIWGTDNIEINNRIWVKIK